MNDVLDRAAPGFRPKVAVILGSGLGSFVEEVSEVAAIPYADLPDFPQPTVGGHAGRLVLGHVGATASKQLKQIKKAAIKSWDRSSPPFPSSWSSPRAG